MDERLKECLWLVTTGRPHPSKATPTAAGASTISANTRNNTQIQLDSMLTHLSAPNPVVKLSTVKDFIIELIPQWNRYSKEVHARVTAFLLKLISIVSKDRVLFADMHRHGVYDAVFSQYDLLKETNPSISLASVNVLTSTADHSAGLDWIIERGHWTHVIMLCRQNRTVYFEREGRKFLTHFARRLNEEGRSEDCRRFVETVVSPLVSNKWKTMTEISDDESSQMEALLLPSLEILLEMLSNVKYYGGRNVLFDALLTTFNAEVDVYYLTRLTRSTPLLTALSKLLFMYQVAKIDMRAEKFKKDDLTSIRLMHTNIMSSLISKRNVECSLNFAFSTLVFLCQLRDEYGINFVIEKENARIEFLDQIMILCMVPMLSVVKITKNEFIKMFIEKVIDMLCEYTTRMAYSYRDLIKEKNSYSDVAKTTQRLIMHKKYLSRSQAVLVFQALYYKLQDFNPAYVDGDVTEHVLVNANTWEAKNLISNLLDCVYMFIDEYDIPWKDSVEVLCVYSYCIRVINSSLDPKLTVKAFKLAQLTIKKFLSPNLALLVNTAEGSIIEEIGKNIYTKLHDPIWDIRDSALELLCIVTDLSEIKFPAFQQQIINNELPELVMTIAKDDSELYVRASALKCIGIMVRIQSIWEKYLQYFNLTNKIMKVLQEESEGLVRKEAATVMSSIYEHQKFPEALLDNVFVIMFHAAVYDLHWEVQVTALNFWKIVIANQKSHQGMIDEVFPSVTFSKEHKKIVHLNDMEIHKRIKKILNELALRGCLGVLLSCMKEDNDIEVKEAALTIIDDINNLITNYKVKDLTTIVDNESVSLKDIFNENFLKNQSNLSNIGKLRNRADIRSESNNIVLNDTEDRCSDTIIDSIVNADDLNLLANVYANQLKVNNEESSEEEAFTFKGDHKYLTDMFVEPQTFLQVIRTTDFRSVIDASRRWQSNLVDSIESLFNDIISANKPADINNLDCY